MSVKLIALTCPRCGGSLEMPVDSDTFYCKYCGALVYADDGSTKIQIDANVRSSIDANVKADVKLHDEAEMRRIELEDRRANVEAYRKRWRRQIWEIPALSFLVGALLFAASMDETGQGSDIPAFLTILSWALTPVYLFLTRPSKYEKTLASGYGMGSRPNRDALLRKLDGAGREDYSEYLRRWRRQVIAYPISLVMVFALARLLVWVEVAVCHFTGAEGYEPLLTARKVLAAVFFAILLVGPWLLYARRPGRYLEDYVRTSGGDVTSRNREG